MLAGMQKLLSYPAGYPLFSLHDKAGASKSMPGIPWPVDIYYDPRYDPITLKSAKTSQLTMSFHSSINGANAIAVIDSGASHSFINKRWTNLNGVVCTLHTVQYS